MRDRLSEEQLADLNLTHAFLNTLSASYQGMYVYENVFGDLTGSGEREEKIAQTASVLDTIHQWWAQFQRLEPLVQHKHRQGMDGDPVRAWRLLEVAQRRLESLTEWLLRSSSVDALQSDAEARAARVAAFCDAAYARQHFIQGLVAYGEILDREEVADRWRQHLLSCQREVREANGLFDTYKRLGETVDEETVADLLDITLTHPVVLGRKAIDIRGVFGLLRNRFDYQDAGIPEEETAAWSDAGFPPADAAQWRCAGMSPEESLAWMEAGIPDPVGAATYAWRGIAMEVAGIWYAQGYNGRTAAIWLARGVSEPSQIPRQA